MLASPIIISTMLSFDVAYEYLIMGMDIRDLTFLKKFFEAAPLSTSRQPFAPSQTCWRCQAVTIQVFLKYSSKPMSFIIPEPKSNMAQSESRCTFKELNMSKVHHEVFLAGQSVSLHKARRFTSGQCLRDWRLTISLI